MKDKTYYVIDPEGKLKCRRCGVKLEKGRAKFIHTYQCDGNPLPSFEGEPKTLELPDMDIDSFTKHVWENLNEDNKVSLFVRYIDLHSGKYDSRIVNKNEV